MHRFRGLVYWILGSVLLIGSLLGSQITSSATRPDQPPQGTLPTFTPAPPIPVDVNLIVTLQRPNSPPPSEPWAVPVHFAFYPSGDDETVLYAWDLTLRQSGTWQGTLTVVPGTYDMRLKNMHTLRNVKRGVTITNTMTIDMGTLHEGDADNDNRVRSSDFSILRAAYFTNEGDPGFDPRADFDEDNRIRSSDFALLRASYFETGDLEVPALAAAAGPAGSAGTVALALEPPAARVAPGDTFTLTLIAHAGDQPFVSMDADIRFPPELLRVVGPDGAPATTVQLMPPLSEVMNQVNNTTGRILFAAGTFDAAVSGDVPLARIRFQALQSTPLAAIRLVDATVADATGKWVTGLVAGAEAWIGAPTPAGYFPLIVRKH